MTYKFALIGTHATGKTTKVYEVTTKLKKRGYSVEMITEVIRSCPQHLSINKKTTKKSQRWITSKQIIEEIEKDKPHIDIIISDRSVIDPIIYAKANNIKNLKMLNVIVKEWVETYDKLFYLEKNEKLLQDDGFRSVDKKFWSKVDTVFKEFLDDNTTIKNKTVFTNPLKENNTIIKEIENTIENK